MTRHTFHTFLTVRFDNERPEVLYVLEAGFSKLRQNLTRFSVPNGCHFTELQRSQNTLNTNIVKDQFHKSANFSYSDIHHTNSNGRSGNVWLASCIVTRLWADGQGMGSISQRGQRRFLSLPIQTSSNGHKICPRK
jgi:hypothetical protein